MPVNKAARVRHEIIDQCLRNRLQKWTRTKLLEFVNSKLTENHGADRAISPSQIRNDMDDMASEYGAPIISERHGTNVFYTYEDPSFSITNLPLEEEDIERLKDVVHLLKKIKGFVIADEIDEIVNRLENKIKYSTEGRKPVIAFEDLPTALGSDNLGDIYESIIHKRVLRIFYKHFRATEPEEQVIHPYYLKEYNNRWFLFGWSEKNSRVENMALDRMTEVKVTSGDYKQNLVFNPESFFSNIIGVTNTAGSVVENIELLFSKERAPYVRTKFLHHSQDNKEYADGRLLVKLSLIINKELKALILGFGNDVEVKKPESLRIEIRSLLEKAIQNY